MEIFREFLGNFKERWEIREDIFERNFGSLLFWIEDNVLFYNPVEGVVRLQSKLLWRVIKGII